MGYRNKQPDVSRSGYRPTHDGRAVGSKSAALDGKFTLVKEGGGIGPQCPDRHLRFIRPLLATS